MEMIQFLRQVDRMEKQLQCLTDSAMSYKSIYSKSAAQMAREAMEVRNFFLSFLSHFFVFSLPPPPQACEQEAASSKKVCFLIMMMKMLPHKDDLDDREKRKYDAQL